MEDPTQIVASATPLEAIRQSRDEAVRFTMAWYLDTTETRVLEGLSKTSVRREAARQVWTLKTSNMRVPISVNLPKNIMKIVPWHGMPYTTVLVDSKFYTLSGKADAMYD